MRNYEKSLLKYQIERLAILKKMKPIKDSLLPYQKRLKQVGKNIEHYKAKIKQEQKK